MVSNTDLKFIFQVRESCIFQILSQQERCSYIECFLSPKIKIRAGYLVFFPYHLFQTCRFSSKAHWRLVVNHQFVISTTVQNIGKFDFMAKNDIESAFNLCPCRPGDFDLLWIKSNHGFGIQKHWLKGSAAHVSFLRNMPCFWNDLLKRNQCPTILFIY